MLLDTIVTYCKVLQRSGRAMADKAIEGEDPAIRKALKESFSDSGKLLKADGTRFTIGDAMSLGIMPI